VSEGETKRCASCGREFAWRKKWKKDWEHVRYCSAACRRRGVTDQDRALERAITELLDARAPGATICPSEAASAVDPDGWRELMEHARRAARRLANADHVELTQHGKPVDPTTFRGPVRARKRT